MKERDLEQLLEDDEIYWKRQSREEWLKWGDRNTKWFHMKENKRRKVKKKIKDLFDENGKWTSTDIEMERTTNNYFHKLF